MASKEIESNIDARQFMRDSGATLTVRYKPKGMWKVKLGLAVIMFGAWIAGIGCDVKEDEEEDKVSL